MNRQIVKAIGQPSCEPSMMLAQDDYIEMLLLDGQVLFKLDDKRRAGEKVRQE